jgi:hypothetical protein
MWAVTIQFQNGQGASVFLWGPTFFDEANADRC